MCKAIPLEAPWHAKKAANWDRITLAHWLKRNVPSKAAHDLLHTAIAGTYTSAASEVSLLYVLYEMASGGGPVSCWVSRTPPRTRDRSATWVRSAGLWRRELGDALHLSQPVRRGSTDADGVTVSSDGMSVRAREVIGVTAAADRSTNRHD